VVRREQSIRELSQEFVTVRLVKCNGLDLSLFQFDYDLTFAVFFFNSDNGPVAIPEPGALGLLAFGTCLIGVICYRRRRSSKYLSKITFYLRLQVRLMGADFVGQAPAC
jgi:hypothetical protein